MKMRRPRIEGKVPGVSEGGSPAPIKPNESMEEAAERLGIQTAEQAKAKLEEKSWEDKEWEAKIKAAKKRK